jgi:hypothetical protein
MFGAGALIGFGAPIEQLLNDGKAAPFGGRMQSVLPIATQAIDRIARRMGSLKAFQIATARRLDKNIIGNHRYLLRPRRATPKSRQKAQDGDKPKPRGIMSLFGGLRVGHRQDITARLGNGKSEHEKEP